MNRKIDTLRLRVLHTKCMTVSEIAETMGASPEEVADKLSELGYAPIFKRDVPEKNTYINKEENTMSRGQKTPVEKVHEIGVLKDEGKTQAQIAELTGVPISTVGKVCARLNKKEEPAPSANDTSSKEKTSTTTIVHENSEDVNPCDENSRTFSEYSRNAMLWCIRQKEAELEKLKIEIRCMKADYTDLMGGRFDGEGQK